jgi:hypothetical protein
MLKQHVINDIHVTTLEDATLFSSSSVVIEAITGVTSAILKMPWRRFAESEIKNKNCLSNSYIRKSYGGTVAFTVGDHVDSLLKELERIDDTSVLRSLLSYVVQHSDSNVADSYGVMIIKRIFDLDVRIAAETCQQYLVPDESLRVRSGYFQLSVLGVIAASIRTGKSYDEFEGWTTANIDRLSAIPEVQKHNCFWPIIAALFALDLVLSDSSEPTLRSLENRLSLCSSEAAKKGERELFFRILGSTLDQAIKNENVNAHAFKLGVFLKFLGDDTDLVHSRNMLVHRLNSIFVRVK